MIRIATLWLHLGFSAMLRILQVPAFKMKPWIINLAQLVSPIWACLQVLSYFLSFLTHKPKWFPEAQFKVLSFNKYADKYFLRIISFSNIVINCVIIQSLCISILSPSSQTWKKVRTLGHCLRKFLGILLILVEYFLSLCKEFR